MHKGYKVLDLAFSPSHFSLNMIATAGSDGNVEILKLDENDENTHTTLESDRLWKH